MINCIAIDDEPLALDLLENNISKISFLHLIGKFDDPLNAVDLLNTGQVDLMFIDIQMPTITGLQFIDSLQNKPLTIVVSAYRKYALESYEHHVVDYLLKPVAMDRFMKACNKAKEIHDLKTGSVQKKEQKFMFLNVGYSLQKVIFKNIIYIESDRDYINIHLKDGQKPLLVRMSMKGIELELPSDQFIRIHKSYIVSINEITALRKNSLFVGDLEIGIGETYSGVVEILKNP